MHTTASTAMRQLPAKQPRPRLINDRVIKNAYKRLNADSQHLVLHISGKTKSPLNLGGFLYHQLISGQLHAAT